MIKDLKVMMEVKWNELVVPKISIDKKDFAANIQWLTRLSAPLPIEWPNPKGELIFYAYARGMNVRDLNDGEYVGPIWGKIKTSPNEKPKFEFITDKMAQRGVQGVGPVVVANLALLQLDPVELLLKKRSAHDDQQLKAYYCLQLGSGNIPPEAKTSHAAFLNWLNCRS